MDLLSQVSASMRGDRPRWAHLTGHAAWACRFPQVPGAAFHFVLGGTASLTMPGVERTTLGAGSVALVPAGLPHRLAGGPTPAGDGAGAEEALSPELFDAAPGAFRIGAPGGPDGGQEPAAVLLSGYFPLDRSQCHPLLDDLPPVLHLPARPAQEAPLRGVLDLLRHEQDTPGMGSDAATGVLLDALFLYVLRSWYREHGAGTGWGPALNDPAISKVLCAMHNSPGLPWTVESLGSLAGLSRSAFARRFTDLVGSPPLAHLTRVRMVTAAQRLRQSDTTLSVIAQQAGYASEFAFSAAFKRAMGTAPSTYRRGAAAYAA
ncbi:AraC family transcriptional regulator [Streptomyces sp. CS090A]|uniref:AraC family transcriptional regulator n=1 Tax=Streptomyces sp. CS090A TaxID=2162710 RepID=UPI0013A57D58|nr:AraC family transcriptional regulator [Streptomyces sp. CS090A]